MDAKYLGVTLSNDLEWAKHIATMTNKANSKHSFLRRNLKGCPEKLKQTAYFSLIRSFMMAPLFGTRTKNTTVTKLRGCSVELQGSSKVGIRDSLVFMICLVYWGGRLFLKGDRIARVILFYKIINGLAQVPFEGVLVEAYKGTRRKHNMKFRQIGHTTSQYGQSFFPKTISAWNGLAFAEALSLAVFRSNFIKN